ncbi:transcription elongation factor GreA [Treponema ruminis]|uniref:Transcription elongation factor GreA n=1 Tax=Treponema ruminis TaxID=744515 RepID=A0A7W8G8L3_9SPIR|nr:transcription elongation factor GreA [Treponema ruminis]MBB5225863.1 transcription elongation factor GreA [Treponema ruminis]QSI02550.1 transcription elongation factor GreA [Treponema ruminis]
MSKELVDLVQAKLKEDTWTRATISNYTKNNLIELTAIVEKARSENCAGEIKGICDEQLSHTKDSITALYISGMLGLKQGSLDNSSLEALVDIFQNNHKEPIVVYMCETILSDDKSNKFALRTLAANYEQEGNAELWSIYERIVKVDLTEAEIAKKLADHYAAENDAEKANEFYKKALLRYVNNKNINSANEIWSKLVAAIPEEIDFFLLVQRKIAKSISADKSALMMQELYNWYKDNKKWDTAIDILKLNLTIDPKDPWARREISDCYAQKYEKHSHVEEYIRSSDLNQSYRNVFEAISDFEKHIAFDARNFVYHRTWGVGVILKVENDTLTINFGKNGKKDISLKMAVNALQPLSKDHIWVIKATVGSKSSKFKTKEELAKEIKTNKAWALKTIITSYNNSCDFKKIKAELVPSILTTSEWTSWNSGAKKLLEEDSTFGVNPNNINEYTVRERAITPEEKYSNEFKAQKAFFARIDILYKFVEDETTDKESELLADMFSYFTGFLKSFNEVDEQVIASYLVVKEVGQEIPSLAFQCKYTFAQLYGELDKPKEMYTILKGSKKGNLRASFLESVKMLPNWEDEYIKMFPAILKKEVLESIIHADQVDKVQKLVTDSFEDFRTYRDVILFLFDECSDEDWFKAANVSLQKQLIAIVNIISQCYREIDNHVESTENKKIINNACKMLFDKDNNKYAAFMLSCDMEQMSHMYTLVDDIRELDGVIKTQLRNKILEKYPDYKFHATEEKSSAPKGMLVTSKKLEEKRALVEKMQNVDIPAIAKEVAEAKEKGDLKENAEYIAAKEAQHKLGNDLKRLQEELARAVVFDPTTATSSIVSFGTKVTLLDKASGKDEEYTILGPWESDPENGVISYMSPFGNAILDHKVGEELSFTINEHKYNFEVKKIVIAKL